MRAALLVVLTACATPQAGTYAITLYNTESSCPDNFFPGEAPRDEIEIEVDTAVPEVVLILIPEEHCPLDGMSFDCAYSGVDDVVDHNADGIDAVYTTEAGISGDWSDPETVNALTSLSTACEGEGCAELAEAGFPACTVAWYWTGVRTGE
jgi:hypothetical protein